MGHKKPHRGAKPTGQFPKAHAMSQKKTRMPIASRDDITESGKPSTIQYRDAKMRPQHSVSKVLQPLTLALSPSTLVLKQRQRIAFVPFYVCWKPHESIVLVLNFYFLSYVLIAVSMVNEISDYRHPDEAFLYYVLPCAISHGIHLFPVLVEQAHTCFPVFRRRLYEGMANIIKITIIPSFVS